MENAKNFIKVRAIQSRKNADIDNHKFFSLRAVCKQVGEKVLGIVVVGANKIAILLNGMAPSGVEGALDYRFCTCNVN